MADKPIGQDIPADLPENWTYGETVAPNGSEVGLSEEYGYNYLMARINELAKAVNAIGNAFPGLVSDTRKINNKTLKNDIALTYVDIAAVPRYDYGLTTGTGSDLSVSLPDIDLQDGVTIRIKLHTDILDNATLNLNGSGAKPIKISDGSNINNKDAKKDAFLSLSFCDGASQFWIVEGIATKETANDILEKIKTVDGSGSGLDADTVDGKHASEFATTKHTHATTDLFGIVAVENGGTSYATIVDTTYTIARYRASALYNTDTTPTTNGVINWTYK